MNRRRIVRSRRGDRHKTATRLSQFRLNAFREEHGVQLEVLHRCRSQDIDGSRRRVRVRRLQLHAGLVFFRLKLREVRMQQRRLAGVRVQVEERRVKVRQEQRD